MNETQEMKRWFTATMVLQGLLAGDLVDNHKKSVVLAVTFTDSLLSELENTKEKVNEPT